MSPGVVQEAQEGLRLTSGRRRGRFTTRTGRFGRKPRAPRIVACVEGLFVGRDGRAAREEPMSDRLWLPIEVVPDPERRLVAEPAGDGRRDSHNASPAITSAATNDPLTRGRRRFRESSLNQSRLSIPTLPAVIGATAAASPYVLVAGRWNVKSANREVATGVFRRRAAVARCQPKRDNWISSVRPAGAHSGT